MQYLKNFIASFLLILLYQTGTAQTLTFHGRGAALKIDKIKVMHPATGFSKLIEGNIINLSGLTGTVQVNSPKNQFTAYPNPTYGNATIDCMVAEPVEATLSLYHANGQLIAQHHTVLKSGQNQYAISTPTAGLHYVHLSGKNTRQTIKLVSLQGENLPASIVQHSVSQSNQAVLKSAQIALEDPILVYKSGDSLSFQCYSGELTSTVTLVPNGDKAYGIQFCDQQATPYVACNNNFIEYSPTVRQEVLGWGCFPSYHKDISWGIDWGIANKPNVQTALFADLGINEIRVSLDNYYVGQTTTIDKTRLSEVKKHILNANSKGVHRWIASLWTPPNSLKEYQTESGFVFVDNAGNILKLDNPGAEDIYKETFTRNGIIYYKKSNRLKPEGEEAFCKYIIDILKYLKDNNISLPVQLSFQNEPRYVEAWYGGCVFDVDQYARVAKLLRKKLDEANMQSVPIAAADHGTLVDAFKMMGRNMSAFQADPEFNAVVDHISFHSYDDYVSWDTDIARRMKDCAELKQTTLDLGKELWMTEYTSLFHQFFTPSLKGNDFGIASHITRHLIKDMLLMPINHWFFWVAYMTAEDESAFLTGPNSAVKKKKLYHVFAKLWKNVVPNEGYRVIELISNDKDIKTANNHALEMIGFEGKTNTVVLVVNPTSKEKPNFKISGIAKGKVANVYTSTATTDMVENGTVENINGECPVKLKANSINILIFN